MNNKGENSNSLTRIRIKINRIKDSYIYRLISKVLSVIGTLILICLIIIGAIMFYFNSKVRAAEKSGVTYIPPFGLYTIISGSMEPNIHVYDVVISVNEKDLSKIKVGDIITFISTWDVNYGLTVTHRVKDVSKNSYGEYQFVTKGDNNKDPDGAVVTQQNFVGKVVARIPYLGRIQFFLATKMGWFMVVFIPALGIIIYDLFKVLKLVVLKKQIDNVENYDDLNSLPIKNDNTQVETDLTMDNTIKDGSITPENTEIISQNEIPDFTKIDFINDSPVEEIESFDIEDIKTVDNNQNSDEIKQVIDTNMVAPNGRRPLQRRKK